MILGTMGILLVLLPQFSCALDQLADVLDLLRCLLCVILIVTIPSDCAFLIP
ncbi:MAG: hypothetical protein ABIF82_09475 [Planctomycetota bacterium]